MKWRFPSWMKKHALSFNNTGGTYDSEAAAVAHIEAMMNDRGTTPFNNAIRHALIVSVEAQVGLLNALHEQGYL